jgi:predicted nuclease of predicted toxin-antitoxin system
VKILFDACTPRPLRRFLPGHIVSTAQEMGWGALKNGDLLREAEGQFEVFVSTDQNLKYQQQVLARKLAILVLRTNDWPTIRSKGAEIAATITSLKPGAFVEMDFSKTG